MARIKLAYIGGGSTRARHHGLLRRPGRKLRRLRGRLDRSRSPSGWPWSRPWPRSWRGRGASTSRSRATTDRRAGLADCDAVLTSFRPGGFEARYLDESIPLKHGVIGQETQGPGGFFMALRSIHVMQGIVADMEAVCPQRRLFNYTNPINLVSEAITHHTAIPTVSLCEGPIIFPREHGAGRRPRSRQGGRGDDRAEPRLVDGAPPATTAQDMMPLVARAPTSASRTTRQRASRRRRHVATGEHDGAHARRLFPVLLLQGRGAGRAAGQADHPRAGHHGRRARLLAALPRTGRNGRAPTSIPTARAAASTS